MVVLAAAVGMLARLELLTVAVWLEALALVPSPCHFVRVWAML